MIYSQYNALISNKFAIWVNWKHEIMTIVFAFLAVLLLYLCTLLLHLRIKKGKLQWEENGFWTKSKGEMEKCRRRIMGLWIGRKKGKILVLWHGDCMHEARSIRAVFMRLWDSHPQSMSTACSASPDGCLHYSLAPCAWASLDYTVECIDTKVLHTLEREPAIVEPRSNLTPCILQRAVLSNLEGHEAWRNHFSIPTSLGLMLTVEAWCAHYYVSSLEVFLERASSVTHLGVFSSGMLGGCYLLLADYSPSDHGSPSNRNRRAVIPLLL